jgi:hypothetical protein
MVARGLQTVSGEQITDGLFLLNAILGFKGTDLRLIPYFTYYTFNTVAGQEEYTVANLLDVDTMTFNIGNVRYPMNDLTRSQYFATGRVDNINSLPFSFRVERQLGGSKIFLYFNPEAVYQVKLWGKFALTDVTLNTELTTLYDGFYIEYLRYALAEYICSEFGVTFPAESMKKYSEIQKKLMDVSPQDLSVKKRTYFNQGWGYDWQTINLTTGYWPGG